MADTTTAQTTQDFVSTAGSVVMETEDQALLVYYQMRSFPELKSLLDQHSKEIINAIQQKNTPTLISIIQKVQSDFMHSLSEQPYQIQLDTEKRYRDSQPPQDEVESRVAAVKRTLEKSYTTSKTIVSTKRESNRKFISRLVQNYSKISEHDAEQLGEEVVHAAESHPELSTQEIIKTATGGVSKISPQSTSRLEKNRDFIDAVATTKNNDITKTDQIIIGGILESSDPDTTIQALQTYGRTNPNTPLVTLVSKAQQLTDVGVAATSAASNPITFTGFFTNVSKSGTPLEKALAPFADSVFSFFPRQAQEAVVARVLGSSWSKEISNNSFLQKAVGPLLQTPSVQHAIQNGNRLLVPEGKHIVLTKTQSFFADVFVTIFHPQVSEVYLQLAGIGNNQMGTSIGAFYAGMIAKDGASALTKKGVKKVGAVAAEKTAGTTLGKVLGGIFGSEGGPVGAFIGSVLFDKVIGGLWNGAKRAFDFVTLGWLSRLFTGDYTSTPLEKDPIFIFSAVLVLSVALLFVFPLLPFSLFGNSSFQQVVQDNAYISGLGGVPSSSVSSGNNAGAGFACVWNGPPPPTTTISRCPAPGSVITQRPFDPNGSHKNADAYDFGVSDGTPIYASHDGYVVAVVTSYAPGQYQYASFGNNVILVGTDASGKQFCTNYGHLLDIAPATLAAYQAKTIVHAGDLIAYSDTTGYTYGSAGLGKGPHLHFGYKGSGSLSLPAGCP